MPKVKITKAAPTLKRDGGASSSSLPVNLQSPSWTIDQMSEPGTEVRKTYPVSSREDANVEAEGGETVLIPDKGGLAAHYNIDGKRHHSGGVALNVPKDSFIFSDTKKMRIKDPEILARFGKAKGSYTPAALAKKYDINKYRKIVQDPDSDAWDIRTGEKMIANYNLKLAQLALVQEGKKGFPQGIPEVAMPFLATYNINPDALLPLKAPTEDVGYEDVSNQGMSMKFGGSKYGNILAQSGRSTKMELSNAEVIKIANDGKIPPLLSDIDIQRIQRINPRAHNASIKPLGYKSYKEPTPAPTPAAAKSAPSGTNPYAHLEGVMKDSWNAPTPSPKPTPGFPAEGTSERKRDMTDEAEFKAEYPDIYEIYTKALKSDNPVVIKKAEEDILKARYTRAWGSGQGTNWSGHLIPNVLDAFMGTDVDKFSDLAGILQEKQLGMIEADKKSKNLAKIKVDENEYLIRQNKGNYLTSSTLTDLQNLQDTTKNDDTRIAAYQEAQKIKAMQEPPLKSQALQDATWGPWKGGVNIMADYLRNQYEPSSDSWSLLNKIPLTEPVFPVSKYNTQDIDYLEKAQARLNPKSKPNVRITQATKPAVKEPTIEDIAVSKDTVRGLSIEDQKKLMGLKFGGSLPQAKKGVSIKDGKYYFEDDKGSITEIDKTVYDLYITKHPVAAVSKPKTSPSKGGLSNRDVYRAPWLDQYAKISGKNAIKDRLIPDYIANENISTDVEGTQKINAPGSFGKKNWWGDADLRADFQRRHKWYLDDYKKRTGNDWNPSIGLDSSTNESAAVNDFQSAYNARAKKFGLPDYFDQSKGFETDSKWGQHTYSAPDFNAPPVEAKPGTPATKNPIIDADPEIADSPQYTVQSAPSQYWLQDVINTGAALNNRLGLKKEMPWAPKYQPRIPRATGFDPTRELAANTEQMNIGTEGAATFAGPQAYNARASEFQGLAAKNAADILARYNNQNVGVANKFEDTKANIYNKAEMYNQDNAKKLYDSVTVANQQYDNSKRKANNELRENMVNAITNKSMTQTLNTLYPHYKVDPWSGGDLNLYKTDKLRAGSPQKTLQEQLTEIKTMASNSGLTPQEVMQYMGKGKSQNRRRDQMEEYDDRSTANITEDELDRQDWMRQRGITRVGPYGGYTT